MLRIKNDQLKMAAAHDLRGKISANLKLRPPIRSPYIQGLTRKTRYNLEIDVE